MSSPIWAVLKTELRKESENSGNRPEEQVEVDAQVGTVRILLILMQTPGTSWWKLHR